MEVKQEYENGEYEKIENASRKLTGYRESIGWSCKTEPDCTAKMETEDRDDGMGWRRDDASEGEDEGLDDIPLPDLPEFEMGIKLEPVPEPVKLPDGTTVPNGTQTSSHSTADCKTETGGDIPTGQNRADYCFKCRICEQIFNTRYEHAVHVAKHDIKCVNCNCKYKTWKDLEDHEVYCTRRFGRILIPPRDSKPAKKPKLRFKCCLCHRRYEKYAHLFDHQVKRCKRRYLSAKWVVKI